jgi:hypothetical protein
MSQTLNDLYPDVLARGGLSTALQAELLEIGSALSVSEAGPRINSEVYARVASGRRSSQASIAVKERLFLFDFWARGVLLARGQTPHLGEMARAIDTWVASNCSSGKLAAAFAFVVVEPKAAIYERGEEVEERWQSYLQDVGFPELAPLVEAASRRRELRQLFPFTSLDTLCFSRCTGYPFTGDTPIVRSLKNGRFEVVSPAGAVLGHGDAEEAAALVVAHLPPGCGPAVAGTADDLS